MIFGISLRVPIDTILLFAIFNQVDSIFWSCAKDGIAMPVIPRQVKGIWYEIARLPSSEVPACLKVIVPDSQSNGKFTLKLDYVNNVNKGWMHTEESLVFPWSEAKKGNFNLNYTDGIINITIKFKYLGSMNGYSVVCGYSDYVSSLSIVRILGRNKLVNSTIKAEIESLANQYNINLSYLTWVQQDGRCNGTGNLSNFGTGVLLVIHLFQKLFHKNFY